MHPLRARLKDLRTHQWPGRRVRQLDLATALGIEHTSISEWESTRENAKLPTADRLGEIATFFASERCLDARRLLSGAELTREEQAERERLHGELLALLKPTAGAGAPTGSVGQRDPWAFGDDAPILIICGAIEPAFRPAYASGHNHNYMATSAYADQDALIELFGHVRAMNPVSDVRYELSRRIEDDDLQAHLVLLGNLAWESAFGLVGDRGLPIRPVREEGLDGEPLAQVDASGNVVVTHRPRFLNDDPTRPVIEDVGYFYRAPSRMRSTRTLTICGGTFTRGVYGAVRCLSDKRARHNVGYIGERLAASSTYGLLMRVPVTDHATGTPDLRDPLNRLFEHTA